MTYYRIVVTDKSLHASRAFDAEDQVEAIIQAVFFIQRMKRSGVKLETAILQQIGSKGATETELDLKPYLKYFEEDSCENRRSSPDQPPARH